MIGLESISQRTFVVTLDAATADRLAAFTEQFPRVTPEAAIAQAVADALSCATPRRAPYRQHLAKRGSDRARAAMGGSRPERQQRRFALEASMPGGERQPDTFSVNGFFGSFTFVADTEAFRQFSVAAEALNQDRSEILFDAISIGMAGAVATAAALEGGAL